MKGDKNGIKIMSTQYIGQAADYEVEFDTDSIRISDTESEIIVTGECVTAKDAENLHFNLKFTRIPVTGDDDKDLTAAWAAIEREVRDYFDGFDVTIVD